MNFATYQNVPKAYIPMLWFRQRAQITSELASQDEFLENFNLLGIAIFCVISLIGLTLTSYGIFLQRRKAAVQEDQEPIITAADES